jgi:hypothetical protein
MRLSESPSSSFLGKLALVATVLTAQPGCDHKKVGDQCAALKEELQACLVENRIEGRVFPKSSAVTPNQNSSPLMPDLDTARSSSVESAEVDPRLTTFKADFDADPTLKSKISWAEIQTRLLANEGKYLALAQAMEQGGQLFGVDAQGRPLISDRGDEPIMKGMNYDNTRDRVLYKHDKNDITGKMLSGKDGKPVATGYEMFPYTEPYGKSPEISQYESHKGSKFVKSSNGEEWCSSWLESGENPSLPRALNSYPNGQRSFIGRGDPRAGGDIRGVRRLLRVEKN